MTDKVYAVTHSDRLKRDSTDLYEHHKRERQ
jgi:hypothetical protein